MSDPKHNFESELDAVLSSIREMLLKKNRAYGDAALNPVRIFSKADAIEQIRVRIDDKLSRLARGNETDFPDEATKDDLLGYLVLEKIAVKRQEMLEEDSKPK